MEGLDRLGNFLGAISGIIASVTLIIVTFISLKKKPVDWLKKTLNQSIENSELNKSFKEHHKETEELRKDITAAGSRIDNLYTLYDTREGVLSQVIDKQQKVLSVATENLKDLIERTYNKYKDEGWIPYFEQESIKIKYDNYKMIGGAPGFVDVLYEKIMGWPNNYNGPDRRK